MRPRELPLPENCRVRLVDLPVQAGGLISVDEEGFVNIYLNARLSRDAQREALQHELRHHYRDDLYSDRDIRTVEREGDAPGLLIVDGTPPEGPLTAFDPAALRRDDLYSDRDIRTVKREADAPGLLTVDGTPLEGSPTIFDPAALRPVGRGVYLPTGETRARAAAHVARLRELLLEACKIYDVMQTPPLLPLDRLTALAGTLGAGDIAFVTWQRLDARCVPVMHLSREDLYGAVYFGDDGAPDNALMVMLPGQARLTVDIRRRRGRLEVCGIVREIDGRIEKVY